MTPPFDFDDEPATATAGGRPGAARSYSGGNGGNGGAGGAPGEPWGSGGAAIWGGRRNRGASVAGGPWSAPGSGAGGNGGGLFAPAAAANYRANMLRSGDVPDRDLGRLTVPTLVICSARDRMLPSLAEGGFGGPGGGGGAGWLARGWWWWHGGMGAWWVAWWRGSWITAWHRRCSCRQDRACCRSKPSYSLAAAELLQARSCLAAASL
jgi:hypothetical protein